MHRRLPLIATLACVALVALPAVGFGCSIAFRVIGSVSLTSAELRRPTSRIVTREAHGLDSTWTSTQPLLNQVVQIAGGKKVRGIYYSRQRALSIDTYGPEDTGWQYFEDSDPLTPPCQMIGQIEWQRPTVFVRENASEVRIAAAAQKTVGDRTGCVYGPDGPAGRKLCPNLTRRVMLLKRPVGARKLVFEQF